MSPAKKKHREIFVRQGDHMGMHLQGEQFGEVIDSITVHELDGSSITYRRAGSPPPPDAIPSSGALKR